MEQAVVDFLANQAWASYLFMAVGFLRLVFKPLMVFLRNFVLATSWTQWDDKALAKFEGSKAYKHLAWVVDYLTSIKLPGAEPKKK